MSTVLLRDKVEVSCRASIANSEHICAIHVHYFEAYPIIKVLISHSF